MRVYRTRPCPKVRRAKKLRRLELYFCFGLSQRGLLHLGQTRGRSTLPSASRARGSHSWPQRQRAPSSMTIPSSDAWSLVRFAIDPQDIRRVLTRPILLVSTNSRYPNGACDECMGAAAPGHRSAVQRGSGWASLLGAVAVRSAQVHRHQASLREHRGAGALHRPLTLDCSRSRGGTHESNRRSCSDPSGIRRKPRVASGHLRIQAPRDCRSYLRVGPAGRRSTAGDASRRLARLGGGRAPGPWRRRSSRGSDLGGSVYGLRIRPSFGGCRGLVGLGYRTSPAIFSAGAYAALDRATEVGEEREQERNRHG